MCKRNATPFFFLKFGDNPKVQYLYQITRSKTNALRLHCTVVSNQENEHNEIHFNSNNFDSN